MQTTRDSVELAGTQVPLMREDQIRVGTLLTGVAMQHIWEVLRIEQSQVFVKKMPGTRVICGNNAHTFAPYGRGQVCSVCDIRKQPISDFMPKREEKARVHVITPNAALVTPQPYTIYGYMLPTGRVQAVSVEGTNWDSSLPVVPTLSVIWTIPERLRAMITGRAAEPQPDIEF